MRLPWRRHARDVKEVLAAADAARERGDTAQALAGYEAAHQAARDRVYPLFWLATICAEQKDYLRAERFARAGLALDPDQVGLLLQLGGVAHALRDPVTALECYERVRALDPNVPQIDALLADQLCYVGRIDDGIAAFERAQARDPASRALAHNRLFCLNYSARLAPAELADRHRAWGRHVEAEIPAMPPVARRIDGPLRVGYVSGDLRDHAVATFLAPLLAHHDRDRFRVTCFDTSEIAEDAVTAELRSYVSEWVKTGSMSDDALAEAIRDAGIDVLIDLSGHTRGNRLEVFARRPAPAQATWLGYLSTTGLSSMDFRITDAYMDPVDMTEALYTERLVRLPVQACFRPSAGTPEIGPSPAGQGSPLTFGSVNQWPKVSDATKTLWGELLAGNPGARLVVVARGGQNASMRELIAADFARHGARAGQIEVLPFMTTAEFLALLGRIDVALDPFPYGGGTTTFQCLWMGVPVVTLAGATAMSRNAVGPLSHVGLADLVAGSREDYLRIATAIGRDTARLKYLRRGLRERMRQSPLMDGPAFARAMERALLAMPARR